MKIVAIIQARLNSKRLPNKTFAFIVGFPLIWHVVNRIKKSKMINQIVIATSNQKSDDKLIDWCINNGIKYFRGSEDNVLERFYFASSKFKADVVVRITADDPFKDPLIIDDVIKLLIRENLDFAYNNNPPSFPEGLDAEVFTFFALEYAWKNVKESFEQEHLTQYLYRHPQLFRQKNYFNEKDFSYLRWTIDSEEDLKMTREVYKRLFKVNDVFLTKEILELLKNEPWIQEINRNVERSAMYRTGSIYEKIY
jgi:spore coat polysaccharide biosynthesis protein SpsF